MKSQAFTLIEIMAAVMIIAVSSMLAIFTVYQHMDSMTLNSCGQDLLKAARYGRLAAAENHRPCVLCIDIDNSLFWLSPAAELRWGNERDNKIASPRPSLLREYLQKRRLPESVKFSKVELAGIGAVERGRVSITFGIDGGAEAALVQISINDNARSLLIYPWTGRAVLEGGQTGVLPMDVIDLDGRGITGENVFEGS